MLMEKSPHQAALVALNDMHGLPVLATNECHQIVADVSQQMNINCSDANQCTIAEEKDQSWQPLQFIEQYQTKDTLQKYLHH